MGDYRATVRWEHAGGEFRRGTYSRAHSWSFDGGVTVPASASPHVVRVPFSDPAGVDPEEALVAAIASCHLLTFLDLARQRGFEVARYEDTAVGAMAKNERGKRWVSEVELAPEITWSGERAPSLEEIRALHDAAHEECFIASSVRTEIRVRLR